MKAQSEQKTAEEILNKIVRNDKDHFAATTYEEDGAGGSSRYTRNDLVEKAMEEYASQFKSQLPIEQKVDYKVERQRFIDDYANHRERENMRDSLGRIFDMWIIPLACRIKELESQPLPIEGGETFSIKDLDAAFVAGRSQMSWEQFKIDYGI